MAIRNVKAALAATAGLSILAGVAAAPASAQVVEEQEAAPGEPFTTDPEAVIPDRRVIVVTARKREELLLDVPISIAVIDKEKLEQQRIYELFDYATRVPNLSFGHTGDGSFTNQSISIRGVQGGGTTALYIDNVPVGESWNPRVVDFERIEVLRGPQGSLFGVGSMGGQIRFITGGADTNDFAAKFHGAAGFVYEGDMDIEVDGTVNFPLIEDKLGLRLTGFSHWHSGVLERTVDDPFVTDNDPFTPEDEFTIDNVDNERAYGGIATLTFTPTPNFYVQPQFMYQRVEFDHLPFRDISPDNFEIVRINDIREPQFDWWWIASLEIGLETDFGNFLSASSKLKRRIRETEDFSEWIRSIVDPSFTGDSFIQATGRGNQYTQEFRFNSDFESPFQITTGLWYSHVNDFGIWPPAIAEGLSEFFGADNIFDLFANTQADEYAVFGEASFEIVDGLILTGGGRYTIDLDVDFTRFDGGLFGSNTLQEQERSQSGFDPRISLSYELDDQFNFYAQAAKGRRAGGFNTPLPSLCDADIAALGITQADTFEGDSLWNYEIGAKSVLAGGALSLSGAAFFIDWDGIPQTVALPTCGFTFTTNTSSAESKGFELEAIIQPSRSLRADLGVGFVDAEITDPGGAIAIEEGDRFQQVPQWTVSGSLEYTRPISNEAEFFALGSYRYVDSSVSFVNAGTREPRVRPSYEIVDLRGGIRWDRIELALFADNLFNEHVNLSDNRSLAVELAGRPRIVTNRPRVVGASIRVNY